MEPTVAEHGGSVFEAEHGRWLACFRAEDGARSAARAIVAEAGLPVRVAIRTGPCLVVQGPAGLRLFGATVQACPTRRARRTTATSLWPDDGAPPRPRPGPLCYTFGAMVDRYEPSAIESKWQAYWDAHEVFRTPADPNLPKYYVLDMFPYPSGAGLHVGHPEGYTATDIVARYQRMRGFNVLHPMGWDAFGLPAEQHAIKTGTHPRDTTAHEHRQLQAPDQDARLQLRLGARGRHHRPGLLRGPSGSSSSSSSGGSRTKPRSRSTGARPSARCWRTRR